jgi:hypothetical protein
MPKLFVLGFVLFLTGCATSRSGLVGVLYTNGQTGLTATSNTSGNRVGEACMSSILGLIATGDASIETARRNGGITQITSVDESHTQFLGFIYGKYCVIVRGK